MAFFAFERRPVDGGARVRGRGRVLLATLALAATSVAHATSQGPVADGPYVGTLPCAEETDCAGVRTTLTLYSIGGRPLVYRMSTTTVGGSNARTVERQGPWSRLDEAPGAVTARLRLEPTNDMLRQSFARIDADTLVLLDRMEQPRSAQPAAVLRRDAAAPRARLEATRTLWRGTLTREADRLMLAPCGGGTPLRVQDVSPEVMITAALTDIGLDQRSSLYLEAFGRMRDGALWIDRLNRAGTEMGCPGEALAFRAQGNEPFWSLAATRERVSLMRPDQPALNAPPLPAPYSLSWRWPGGRPDRAEALLAVSTEGHALTARLTPNVCRDTMADAVFGFTAVVALARPQPATEFKGCAFLGTAALP